MASLGHNELSFLSNCHQGDMLHFSFPWKTIVSVTADVWSPGLDPYRPPVDPWSLTTFTRDFSDNIHKW